MKRTLAETVLSGEEVFKQKALNASSEQEKSSFLRCAEASARLGSKLSVLNAKDSDQEYFAALNKFPEHRLLVNERMFRTTLNDGDKLDG